MSGRHDCDNKPAASKYAWKQGSSRSSLDKDSHMDGDSELYTCTAAVVAVVVVVVEEEEEEEDVDGKGGKNEMYGESDTSIGNVCPCPCGPCGPCASNCSG